MHPQPEQAPVPGSSRGPQPAWRMVPPQDITFKGKPMAAAKPPVAGPPPDRTGMAPYGAAGVLTPDVPRREHRPRQSRGTSTAKLKGEQL